MTRKQYKNLKKYDDEIQNLSYARLNTRLKKLSNIYAVTPFVSNEHIFLYFKAMLLIHQMGRVDPLLSKMNPFLNLF